MLHKFLQKFPPYLKYKKTKLQKQSKFYQQNYINVLVTYRHFLKIIPKIYPRTLQQSQKLNEIRWVYKSSKQLPNIYQCQNRTNFAMNIMKQIQSGNYQSLGDYTPFRFALDFKTMENFLRNSTPRRKYWWWGHIY